MYHNISCIEHGFDIAILTLQAQNFHWNLNFAISLMANSLNLNITYLKAFTNLSMIADIDRKSKIKIRY
mgnify:CR=1 FL=1